MGAGCEGPDLFERRRCEVPGRSCLPKELGEVGEADRNSYFKGGIHR